MRTEIEVGYHIFFFYNYLLGNKFVNALTVGITNISKFINLNIWDQYFLEHDMVSENKLPFILHGLLFLFLSALRVSLVIFLQVTDPIIK